MIFGEIDVTEAKGCYLAHSQKTQTGRVPKGRLLDDELVQQLVNSGIKRITVAKLDPTDTHEDTAAHLLADALAGPGTRLSTARTGRVNLYATTTGLCCLTPELIVQANSITEAITIATLPANSWVPEGKMIATIKIIPYAVNTDQVHAAMQIFASDRMSVLSPSPKRAALIQTLTPAVTAKTLDKTHAVTEQRLRLRSADLISEQRCEHTVQALLKTIEHAQSENIDWLLIIGASAISDRDDIIPSAITQAGGTVDRYGIPVDPGNLLLLANLGQTTVIGLPGCARSARINGLDLILDRLACAQPITNAWLTSLSVGGLMTEIADRPKPRVNRAADPVINGLLLAAGLSRRAGEQNKLFYHYQGEPLLQHAAKALLQSGVKDIVAISGHQHERIYSHFKDSRIQCQHNPAYATGMASSLATGVSRLSRSDALVVCLADMPHVSSEVIDTLINAFRNNTRQSLFVPTYNGRRGNPVLISKIHFDTLLTLSGDAGARFLLHEYPEQVCEVEVDYPGILQDYDTPSELQQLKQD